MTEESTVHPLPDLTVHEQEGTTVHPMEDMDMQEGPMVEGPSQVADYMTGYLHYKGYSYWSY